MMLMPYRVSIKRKTLHLESLQNDVSNFYLIGNAFFLLTFSFAKEKVSYLLASSIATATRAVIPSIGLLPALVRIKYMKKIEKII